MKSEHEKRNDEMEKQNDTWKNVICSDVKLWATTQRLALEYSERVSHTRVLICSAH